MFAIIHTHIVFDGDDSKMEIVSKHRTREAAVKKLVKIIPSFYWWDSEEEFDEAFPEDRENAAQEGMFVTCDEGSGEWGDMLAILEL